MVTCFVFFRRFRKGPEPEEMDKDMILQEKEAEVGHRHWRPWWCKWLLCVCERWIWHTWGFLVFHSWDECRRWSPRCRPKCRSREMERVKAPMCEKLMVSLQVITFSNHTISPIVIECHEMWSLLVSVLFSCRRSRPERLTVAETVWRPFGLCLVATIINSDPPVGLDLCFFLYIQ